MPDRKERLNGYNNRLLKNKLDLMFLIDDPIITIYLLFLALPKVFFLKKRVFPPFEGQVLKCKLRIGAGR